MKLTEDTFRLVANTIRCLCADMVEKAKSGHPGAPMGMADLASVLWLKHLNVDPKDPEWAGRDRLVFSGGHASSLVYALFHLSGMGGLKMEELMEFRQWGSRCAGHPERGVTPGVEVTTGPLGQGIAMRALSSSTTLLSYTTPTTSPSRATPLLRWPTTPKSGSRATAGRSSKSTATIPSRSTASSPARRRSPDSPR